MSTTPVANLPPVSTTPAANFVTSSPCAVDTGRKSRDTVPLTPVYSKLSFPLLLLETLKTQVTELKGSSFVLTTFTPFSPYISSVILYVRSMVSQIVFKSKYFLHLLSLFSVQKIFKFSWQLNACTSGSSAKGQIR